MLDLLRVIDDQLEWDLVEVKPQRFTKTLSPLLNLLGEKAFICGGMARYVLSENENTPMPGDIDVYAISDKAYFDLYRDLEKSLFIVKESVGATTFSTSILHQQDNLLIQLVKPEVIKNESTSGKFEDAIKSILDKFDFTVACAALTGDKRGFVHPSFQSHDKRQQLVINHINCPVATTLRIFKYYKKGYWAKSSEVIKCLDHWEKITPTDTKEKAQELLKGDTETDHEALYSLLTFID